MRVTRFTSDMRPLVILIWRAKKIGNRKSDREKEKGCIPSGLGTIELCVDPMRRGMERIKNVKRILVALGRSMLDYLG